MKTDLDAWVDAAGLFPPLPKDVSEKIFATPPSEPNVSGKHTFSPLLMTRQHFNDVIFPRLKQHLDSDVVDFISKRVSRTFELRDTLKRIKHEIVSIVGEGNFSALWLDREAFSADSMEHRALITEAVIHVYSAQQLQRLVTLLYKNEVPMIPYGEGGGYNMGVTPMAPAVTISLRGIDHISEIRPSRRSENKFEISVGAGVPFKDLQAYLNRRGYVLRCDPNTPRAATGGIAATGSNGGRKAFEVVVHGRAVTADGVAACFAVDEEENKSICTEPFLLARKFFSIEDPEKFAKAFASVRALNLEACVTPNSTGVQIPLQGMKASANMLAQQMTSLAEGRNAAVDTMANSPCLPISAFIGAEGCTGFIYEVTLEIERPWPYLKGARLHFRSTDSAMNATRAIKKLPENEQPQFFEVITGASIRSYLLQDFPNVFSRDDEAVIIFGVEGPTPQSCEEFFEKCMSAATTAVAQLGNVSDILYKMDFTSVLDQTVNAFEFEVMKRPREELPKKLRTKCKTDMEIRTEYLGEVLKIVAGASPRARADEKRDVLFGHLTPRHTAIIHWNIGGFDLYDEEQADVAWEYLENVIGKAQSLAPPDDIRGSARFTGEHGLAGKAPFLWLNHIPQADFERMCRVKDILDPKDLFNPDTIFLRNSIVRSLRARLLSATHAQLLTNSKSPLGMQADDFAISEGLRCTRCTSCKICPVIDAEHALAKKGKRKANAPVLPSKRNILMFMERIAIARKTAQAHNDKTVYDSVMQATNSMLAESAALLKKCFYCRKCDKACPVDINIHPLTRAYQQMGKLPRVGSRVWAFIYERLMGEDVFKALTYRVVAFFILLGTPILALIRRISILPDWVKTYTVPPTLAMAHYEPLQHGRKLNESDNFTIVDSVADKSSLSFSKVEREKIYIRYRGCMDTFGKPSATSSVDTYFKEVLNSRIVDLEKKLCCGFPFEADGLHERAKKSQFLSMIEIAKCIARLVEEHTKSLSAGKTGAPLPEFVVFSNCPTCCEAIREMKDVLGDTQQTQLLKSRAGLAPDFDVSLLNFSVQDTAEIAVELLEKTKVETGKILKAEKTVGLKVPCHNTKAATAAQVKLLKMYYEGVASYDNCCGLSGTGRLKHPKIGTEIASKLFEQIGEQPPQVVVSGCPSCRDGVKIQRNILKAQNDAVAEFDIAGIFEQILQDQRKVQLNKEN